jgi:hypothetical protein
MLRSAVSAGQELAIKDRKCLPAVIEIAFKLQN